MARLGKGGTGSVNAITEGVVWKQLLLFFFPILLGSLFQQLYNTVDALIVGNFVGKQALAAVGGATAELISLIVGFFMGVGAGGAVIVSQYFGAKQPDEVSRTVHTSIAMSLLIGAFIMLFGLLFAPTLLQWMNTPADVIDHAAAYLRIYFAGMIPMSVYNIGAGIIRAIGDSRRPLYYLIIGSFTNIALDLLFVPVFGWGVSGAALATMLSQTICAVLTVISLCRSQECWQLLPRKIRLHGDILYKVARLGIPRGIQSTMYSFANVLIQSSINSFGTDVVAAYTAYGKLDALYSVIVGSMGVAVTTFAGQNFGAGKIGRVHSSVRFGLGFSLAVSVLANLLAQPFGHYALALFTDDPAVIAHGVEMIRVIFPGFLVFIGLEIFTGALHGAGDSFVPTLVTIFGICVLRVTWITFVSPQFGTLTMTLICYPISWTVTSLLFLIYYLKGGWIRRGQLRMGITPQEEASA